MNLVSSILSSPQDRWKNGGGHFERHELRDGREVDASVFDLPPVKLHELNRDEIWRGGRVIGYYATIASSMRGEGPRLNHVRRVFDSEAIDPELYVGDGTALGTSPRGYADSRAHLTALNGVSVIQNGEAYSYHGILDTINPARIAMAGLRAGRVSQMRSAQIEQATSAEIRRVHGIGDSSFQIGDSQPGIKMAATVFAAEQLHGVDVVGINPRAVLCFEALNKKSLLEAGKWLANQGFASAELVGSALIRKDYDSVVELAQTIEVDPAFLLNMVFGSTPALLNGELSHTIDLMPREIAGMQTIGVKDHLLRKSAKTVSAQFPNMVIEKVNAGHLFVVDPKYIEPQVEYLTRVAELHASGARLSELSQDQHEYVYGKKFAPENDQVKVSA